MYFYDFQHPPYRATVLIRDHGAYNLNAKSYEIKLIYARQLEKGEAERTAPAQIGGRPIQPCSREFMASEGTAVAIACGDARRDVSRLTLAETSSNQWRFVATQRSSLTKPLPYYSLSQTFQSSH